MIFGYARVSTQEQKLQLQLDALEDYGCERTYTEHVSGAAKERPELERCFELMRDGDTFVVWKLDRLGRSLPDLIEKIRQLDEMGVDFVSITQGIDTSTAQGKLMFHIFGALAEFNRSLIQERTTAGLEAARRQGVKIGRPAALAKDDMPALQALVRDSDVSTKEICERFEISKATLYKYVSPEGDIRKMPDQ